MNIRIFRSTFRLTRLAVTLATLPFLNDQAKRNIRRNVVPGREMQVFFNWKDIERIRAKYSDRIPVSSSDEGDEAEDPRELHGDRVRVRDGARRGATIHVALAPPAAVTVSVSVVAVLAASEAMAGQPTVPLALVPPPLALTKVTPAGSGSATATQGLPAAERAAFVAAQYARRERPCRLELAGIRGVDLIQRRIPPVPVVTTWVGPVVGVLGELLHVSIGHGRPGSAHCCERGCCNQQSLERCFHDLLLLHSFMLTVV